jgi:diaminohydroxyphosphoribosylaminopyrimidine deaminase/5-amino-6-(5-phosphoribosylamino)uracil reductase
MFSKSPPAEVILATTRMAPKNRISRFKRAGNEVLVIKEKNGAVDLCQLMDELGRREITSVMAEGGGELIGSLVEEGLVDKFLFFIAPKIIGGRNAITSVEGKGISRMKRAPILEGVKYKTVGRDLLIEGYLTPN